MINSRVELLFKNLPDKYPYQLERHYIRILNRLMQIWDMPEFDSYMRELVMGKRGGRQGFPPEVVAELLFLGELHDIFRSKQYYLPEIPDSWQDIPVPNPTPQGFYQAIERGQLELIEAFLGAGIKVDYRFEGAQTPLMVAVISGQLGAVRCLIEGGAGVNLRDEGEYTALHWAAFYDRSLIVEVLIDAYAEINVTQKNGDTPLALAVARGHTDAARLLMECKAASNTTNNHDSSVIIESGKKGPENESHNYQTDSRTDRGDIPPRASPEKEANLNKSAKVEEIVGRNDKFSPFRNISPARLVLISIFVMAALSLYAYQSYHKRLATTQIQSQADNSAVPDSPVAVPPKPHSTELQQSSQSNKQLKKHTRHKAKKVQTAVNNVAAYTFDDLMNAVWHSDINGVDRLLQQGMDINRRDGSGSTPLIVAVENNDLNMVKHLIEKGADPNIPRQHDGYSPIVVAKTASKPNAELIEFLKVSGAHNPFDQSVSPLPR
jgi:ankyrin repeat protein